jgi:hypothetical protein
MTAGTTSSGVPLAAKSVPIVRGPFLINPAFAGRSGAASTLSQTTFRGRFGDRLQRLGRRMAVIGWIGSLFWPYAYGDLIDYTFWPYAYDSFWPRAYDDVYEGIFGPYAADAASFGSGPESSYVDEPQSPYVSEPLSPGDGKPNIRRKDEYLAQVCNVPVSGLAVWPIEHIAKVVEPDDSQRAALDQLKDAAERSIELLRSGCPTEVPSTPPRRLAAMRSRVEIALQVVENTQPALDKFYQSLSDEQKARFNAVGPEGLPVTDAARSTMREECRAQVEKIAELPAARIAEAVRPTPEQQAAIDDLNAASVAASDLLKMNCLEDQVLTPPGRLMAMAQRLAAILQAVKAVQPPLERFYNMLSDEQKAQFNMLGVDSPSAQIR